MGDPAGSGVCVSPLSQTKQQVLMEKQKDPPPPKHIHTFAAELSTTYTHLLSSLRDKH